jgi:Tfp pilus assembly protein FimT
MRQCCTAVVVVALMLSMAVPVARAGCAAMTTRQHLEVLACRVHDASRDPAFLRDVEAELARPHWASESRERMAQTREQILARNTGALITARVDGTGPELVFFRAAAAASACGEVQPGQHVIATTHPRCPMVTFAAPVQLVIDEMQLDP